MNIYYIISSDSVLIPDILTICVEENIDAMRKNNDGSKLIFKLPINISSPDFLKTIKSFTHTEIINELSKQEWI